MPKTRPDVVALRGGRRTLADAEAPPALPSFLASAERTREMPCGAEDLRRRLVRRIPRPHAGDAGWASVDATAARTTAPRLVLGFIHGEVGSGRLAQRDEVDGGAC